MTGNQLPRCTPKSQGVASSSIMQFVETAEMKIRHLHSLMLLRHGTVVAEGWWHPYAAHHPHMLFSLSKSFTSTGIGLAVSEGKLSLDDRVISFFPGDEPRVVSTKLAAMSVRHLLTMTTGHDIDTTEHLFTAPDGNWTRAFLELPVKFKPGTHFLYNTGASYMLSAIVQKVTGMTLLNYLEWRLFKPLGIEGATWEISPQGINTGGFGLSIKTEDIARFGQLLLQKGKWNGQQILKPSWVELATSYQVPNGPSESPDWGQGYGFQFWRCRHNAFRGDGACGQYCLVLPEQDAVLAITAGVENMQEVLDCIWENLLPGMKSASLPEDPQSLNKLAEKLGSLALKGPEGKQSQRHMEGIYGRWYGIDPNPAGIEKLRLDFNGRNYVLTMKDVSGEQRITCGTDSWFEGETTLFHHPIMNQPMKIAARGAWTGKGVLAMELCFYETPFSLILSAQFNADHLQIDTKANVTFGNLGYPSLAGRFAAS